MQRQLVYMLVGVKSNPHIKSGETSFRMEEQVLPSNVLLSWLDRGVCDHGDMGTNPVLRSNI